MKLPFLKNKKIPRVQNHLTEQKLVNGDPDDLIDDHAMGEIFDSIEKRDHKALRHALEALCMNCFDRNEAE